MLEVHIYEKTVAEVYEALEKNGFDLTHHQWFVWKDGMVTGACVLGQTALNLQVASGGVNADFYSRFLGTTESFQQRRYESTPDALWNDYDRGKLTVWAKNEEALNAARKAGRLTLKDQLNRLPNLSKKFRSLAPAGESIISWNDRTDNTGYVLKTYKEVAAMAKDILAPHFKRKVYLLQVQVPSRPLAAVS